jgi:nuclear transport factor 2 (NTF2) superfamily protein
MLTWLIDFRQKIANLLPFQGTLHSSPNAASSSALETTFGRRPDHHPGLSDLAFWFDASEGM